ncbi:hypothetical protein JTB14_003396 [Gonioctena quinquepunctata]|nr:hypothetical protein JTB14_003396 [Gonioctena quinquepunctata]
MTTDPDLLTNIELESPIGKSDHAVINTSIQVIEYPAEPNPKLPKNFNYVNLKRDLGNFDWADTLAEPDMEQLWTNFTSVLQKVIYSNTTALIP